ncbi:hypothetical protein PIB30_040750 [Stylosanthes scabra]|uniref:Uncharacterized protein n=1 Tax=Stylosanthes scabra TaxID=79078 RepID=A0ABU6WCV2_9FABA|nr:hypothetical protein [Stylosanthes scabra]
MGSLIPRFLERHYYRMVPPSLPTRLFISAITLSRRLENVLSFTSRCTVRIQAKSLSSELRKPRTIVAVFVLGGSNQHRCRFSISSNSSSGKISFETLSYRNTFPVLDLVAML